MNVSASASKALLVCGVAMLAAGCSARAPARTFADLQPRLRPGHTIYVTDDTGSESRGTLTALSLTRLDFDVNGVVRQLDESRVRQVQRYGDSLRNGAITGMAIALPAVLLADPQYKPCTTEPDGSCAQNDVGYRLLMVGVMGGIGAGIDALMRSRQQVFLAPGQPGTARQLRVDPILRPSVGGVAVRVMF